MIHSHMLYKRPGLSCFLTLMLGSFFICVTVAQTVQPSENLEPGKTIERQLKGGEKHTYQLVLKANEYVKLVVEQKGADVVIRFIGPDGKTIREVDSLYIKQGQKQLSLITDQAGHYVVEIESLVKTSPPGKYELKLAVAKAATGPDRAEMEIETLLGEVAKLTQTAKFDQALPIAEKAVAKSETAFGPGHPLVATCLNELAAIYWIKNLFGQVEPLLVRSLAIREKALGKEHPDVLESLNNLAALYYSTGDYAKAEPLYLRTVDLFEKVLGPNHSDFAVNLNNLAALYQTKGDFAKAELFYQRALAIYEKVFGPNNQYVAINLNNLATLYMAKGDHARAEPLFQRSLAISENVLGPNHQYVALNLNNLATIYKAKGDYARAEPLFQRALTIREKTLGPNHPSVAQSLNHLASLYSTKADYSKAEPLYQRALAIMEKALGPDHMEVAISLNHLANLYLTKADYPKAEALYQRALAIREKALGSDHQDVAISLNNLANLYLTKADYSKAEALYQRALAIMEKALGPDHMEVATSLNNLGKLYSIKGDYPRAEPLYQRALTIREKALGPNHQEVAASLLELADLYWIKGSYVKAESLYQRALAIREKVLGSNHPDVAQSLSHLAAIYWAKGDYLRAEPLYQRALAIEEKSLGPDHPVVAYSLKNLGNLYSSKGDYQKAEPLYQRALAIEEKVLGPDHPVVASSLNSLATVYRSQGNYQQAKMLYQQALTINEKMFGPNHREVAVNLMNLGSLYLIKSEYQQAEPLFRRSLAIWEKAVGPDHPNVAFNLAKLARLFRGKGDPSQAIQFQTRCNDTSERDLLRNLVAGSEQQKALYLKTTARYTDLTLSLHLQSAPQFLEAKQAALTVVLRRKGRALDAMISALERLRGQQTPEVQKLLDEYASLAGQISALTFRGTDKQAQEEHLALLKALETQADRLEADLSAKSLEFKTQFRPITVENVQQQIPPGGVLVEYVSYQPYEPKTDQFGVPRLAVYTLNQAGEIKWADLGEVGPVEQAVSALRQVVSKPKASLAKDIAPAAQALDKLVMQPVLTLVGNANHLLISPDGVLNLIPFSALMDDQRKFLVENYTLTYLTSGRDLLRLAVKIQSPEPPLVMADPNYLGGGGPQMMGRSLGRLGRLVGTRFEGEHLKVIFPDARLKMRTEATETEFKQVNRPVLVHIATHGFFLEDAPQSAEKTTLDQWIRNLESPPFNIEKERESNPLLRSMLFFAGANQGGTDDNDGVMTALEAAQLNLWGTKLVTLSACDTGLGDVKNGDGVYGLRRALVLAGSESQMMSLWPVSDQATRELMVEYYTRLKVGEGRSQALRNVQLKMLKNPRRQHPFYWASFIQSGEWANLEGKR